MQKEELIEAAKHQPLSIIDRSGHGCTNSDLLSFLTKHEIQIREIGRQTYLVTTTRDAQAYGLEQGFVVLMPIPTTSGSNAYARAL